MSRVQQNNRTQSPKPPPSSNSNGDRTERTGTGSARGPKDAKTLAGADAAVTSQSSVTSRSSREDVTNASFGSGGTSNGLALLGSPDAPVLPTGSDANTTGAETVPTANTPALTGQGGAIFGQASQTAAPAAQTTAAFGQSAQPTLAQPQTENAAAAAVSRSSAATAGPSAEAFYKFALTKKGGPYVWGGNGPSGYDCSGLVLGALKSLGLSLPRTAAGMQSAAPPMSVEQALRTPGALLFSGRPATHVAISLGNGQTIEAYNSAKGINVFNATGRNWTSAAYAPGLNYDGLQIPAMQDAVQVSGSDAGGGGGEVSSGGGESNAGGASESGGSSEMGGAKGSESASAAGKMNLSDSLLEELWKALKERNDKAVEEKLAAIAPNSGPEVRKEVSKALMADEKLAAAAKSNPAVLEALMKNPDIAKKVAAGEMTADQALAALGVSGDGKSGETDKTASASSESGETSDEGGSEDGGEASSSESASTASRSSGSLTSQVRAGRVSISG